MTDYGTTDTSTTVLAANQFPVGAVFVPGDSKLTAAQGGPKGTDSNGKTYAPAAIYLPDGNDATQGTSTDAAWSGSGAATSIALLKKLVAELAGTLSVSGAITANAGTNLNTSPLALESGGNLASLKTDADAINTAIGAQADAAWSGSGSGSEIAILKKVVALLAATLTVSGTVTNQQSNVQSDYDTGAGTQNMTMFGVALPASGGAVAGGTTSNPMRIDPTGTTTQPVSAASLPLPTGAAQEGGNLASISSNTSNTATVAGATADAAVTGDNAGTLSAKLRGLTKILADIWDSVNHRIKVDGSGVTQPVSGTFWQATQPVSGTVTANQGGAPWAENITQLGGTAIDTNSGNKSAGTLRVVLATDQPALTNTQPVQDKVASSGGEVPYHNLSANTTNFTNVKGVACQLYGFDLSNTSSSTIFVKFYDKATAPSTGDTPKRTIQVPANSTVARTIPKGMQFASGFGWAATGAVADNDTTAIAASCVIDFDLNS
jgi:hypothetical protein